MNKVAIITLTGYFNFGNRLQNYALSRILNSLGYETYTVWNRSLSKKLKEQVKSRVCFIRKYKRFGAFYRFSKKNIKEISLKDIKKIGINKVVVGSDQVWNPKYYEENHNLLYNPIENQKVISYAASIGTSKIDEMYINHYKEILRKYDLISVRERKAEEELKRITGREDIITLIDPTLLLNRNDWEYIEKKPRKFDTRKKYILNYFLGQISQEEKETINLFAKENDYTVINILEKKDDFFLSGPEEFVFLLNHSDLICTDSFHACVFSFIFDKPFIVFKRKGCSDYMYSRIENLLTTFQLEGREYIGVISKENLTHNYTKGYKVLLNEKKKSIEFLKRL